MQNINKIYATFLAAVREHGEVMVTRNAEVTSAITLENTFFNQFPLVTVRKTAWKKAIREMEWFLSGVSKCPEELKDWWEGQLDRDGHLLDGYPAQFRNQVYDGGGRYFDQVWYILSGLQTNPNSRRLLMSSWNTGDMANITATNSNPDTPTSCHSIVVQFFVREGLLHMKTYQRSADMLLGVPHNWVQSWAMLLYFAHHAGLKPGAMIWMWGDAHIYSEESHAQTVNEILAAPKPAHDIKLIYAPEKVEYDSKGVPVFRASDFYVEGEIPEPVVKIRPKLL